MDINITLIGQMITFMIFVGFTMKFVWPPLKNAMDERRAKIAEGLAFSENVKKELEAAKQKAHEIVSNAKTQATQLLSQADVRAMQINEEAKVVARTDAERILKAADDEATASIDAMRQDLRKEVGAIAIAGAEKLINKNIDKTVNQHLLEEMAANL